MTKSGLSAGSCVSRILKSEESFQERLLFASAVGQQEKDSFYEPYLFFQLRVIQMEEAGVITLHLEVDEPFGISRSFRRGSATAASNAPNAEYSDKDVEKK